jgi:hypothetical protein
MWKLEAHTIRRGTFTAELDAAEAIWWRYWRGIWTERQARKSLRQMGLRFDVHGPAADRARRIYHLLLERGLSSVSWTRLS